MVIELRQIRDFSFWRVEVLFSENNESPLKLTGVLYLTSEQKEALYKVLNKDIKGTEVITH